MTKLADVRDDSGPLPTIVLVFLSVTLILACFFMSEAPQPTQSGIDSHATFGSETCFSYVGTPYDC